MHYKKNEEGIALITTLLMLGLMLVMAMSAIFSSTTDIQVSRNVKENTRDIFVADGGLEWLKSQISYYGNNKFAIRNPITNTLNAISAKSGDALFIDGLSWITEDGLSTSADAMWKSPAETACTSDTGRDASAFPLFYTSVSIGTRTACLKVFSPVWEGIYYPRLGGGVEYYPRDHIGNYHLNFDSGPVESANPSKPNFFSVRFPDVTSTETISVPQKSVMSDVRLVFGNNLYFFQEEPYADPQICNITEADNPATTCLAYNPNSAASTETKYGATAAITPAIDSTNSKFEGVCTNTDDTKVLVIYKTVAGVQYIQGIAQRYDNDPSDAGTDDDTPYTFMLGNNGTSDIGTEINGVYAASNCPATDGTNAACGLSDFKDDNNNSYAGFIEVVKIGVNDGACQGYIYVPYNKSTSASTLNNFEPLEVGESIESKSITNLTYDSGVDYSMRLEDVADYMSLLFAKLEEVNNLASGQTAAVAPSVIPSGCEWSALTSITVYTDNTFGTDAANSTGATFDFSKYETQTSPAQSVTEATGTILTLNGINVNHDNLTFPQ